MESNPPALAKLERFTNWIIRGHLADLSEIAPSDLLAIFEKLQTAKSRQVFVAMAFRPETVSTYNAIKAAVDQVNNLHHLDIQLRPIRIDEFDNWHSYKIRDEIMRLITESGVLIADLTYGNANVYHEIGFLFGLNEGQRAYQDNCILIWNDGRLALGHENKDDLEAIDVRFDLKDFSQIRFNNDTNSLRDKLAIALNEHFNAF